MSQNIRTVLFNIYIQDVLLRFGKEWYLCFRHVSVAHGIFFVGLPRTVSPGIGRTLGEVEMAPGVFRTSDGSDRSLPLRSWSVDICVWSLGSFCRLGAVQPA